MFQLYHLSSGPASHQSTSAEVDVLDAVALKELLAMDEQLLEKGENPERRDIVNLLLGNLKRESVQAEFMRIKKLILDAAGNGQVVPRVDLMLFIQLSSHVSREDIASVFAELHNIVKAAVQLPSDQPVEEQKTFEKVYSVFGTLSSIGFLCPGHIKLTMLLEAQAVMERFPLLNSDDTYSKALNVLGGAYALTNTAVFVEPQNTQDTLPEVPEAFYDAVIEGLTSGTVDRHNYVLLIFNIRAPSLNDEMKERFMCGLELALEDRSGINRLVANMICVNDLAPFLSENQCQRLVASIHQSLSRDNVRVMFRAMDTVASFKNHVDGITVSDFIVHVKAHLSTGRTPAPSEVQKDLVLSASKLVGIAREGEALALFRLYKEASLQHDHVRFLHFCHTLIPHLNADERRQVIHESAEGSFERNILRYFVERCHIPEPVAQAASMSQAIFRRGK